MAMDHHSAPRALAALAAFPRTSVAQLGGLAQKVRHSAVAPGLRNAGWPLAGVCSVLVAAALLVLSWERLGNISVGPYNIKLPVMLFALALAAGAPLCVRGVLAFVRRRTVPAAIVVVAAAAIAVFVARALFVVPVGPGIGQIASVLTGAAGPALVLFGIVQSREDLLWALRWIVRGAIVAGSFGLWQLFAFYTGLPQGVDYTGVGTSGVGGRIAGFSYEPAYFAYYMVLAAGAALTIARMERRAFPWRGIAFFGVVLALANVRALLVLLPVVGVLLAVDWRRNRSALVRGAVAAVPIALVVTFAPVLVTAAFDSISAAMAPRASAGSASGDAPGQQDIIRSANAAEHQGVAKSARSGRAEAVPQPAAPAPAAVFDPNEQSSNAPRIEVYKAVLAVDLANPVLGVGPGGLEGALNAAEDKPAQPHPGLVVANNIWLQAGADGGAVLVLLEVALTVGMAVLWWRARRTAVQPMVAVWLAVVLVGGMLTSYFFDLKLWVVSALILLAVGRVARRDGEGRTA